MPEMMLTAWGALFKSLRLEKGDQLLIRGGTTSVGLAAAAIAKNHGVTVASTTRRSDREKLLGDNGAVADHVHKKFPDGFSKILELVGTTTLNDSLQCAS